MGRRASLDGNKATIGVKPEPPCESSDADTAHNNSAGVLRLSSRAQSASTQSRPGFPNLCLLCVQITARVRDCDYLISWHRARRLL